MGKKDIYLDNFSGAVADLKKPERTNENVLKTLSEYSMVSTWDMSENRWLCKIIESLEKKGLIVPVKQSYPWHKWKLTEAGEKAITV